MPKILKYNLDCSSLGLITVFESTMSIFLYSSWWCWDLRQLHTLLVVIINPLLSTQMKLATILQSQDLRVGQEKEPCIGFTQENSIENSV